MLCLPCLIEQSRHILFLALETTQQTQNICITFVQCWTNVKDVGPTLYKSPDGMYRARERDLQVTKT